MYAELGGSCDLVEIGKELLGLDFLLLFDIHGSHFAHPLNKVFALVIDQRLLPEIGPEEFIARFVIDGGQNPLEEVISRRSLILNINFPQGLEIDFIGQPDPLLTGVQILVIKVFDIVFVLVLHAGCADLLLVPVNLGI